MNYLPATRIPCIVAPDGSGWSQEFAEFLIQVQIAAQNADYDAFSNLIAWPHNDIGSTSNSHTGQIRYFWTDTLQSLIDNPDIYNAGLSVEVDPDMTSDLFHNLLGKLYILVYYQVNEDDVWETNVFARSKTVKLKTSLLFSYIDNQFKLLPEIEPFILHKDLED